MAEHDGAEHFLFGQLVSLGFHHHHGVLGPGDDLRPVRCSGFMRSCVMSSIAGFSTYLPSTKPTRAAPIGPTKKLVGLSKADPTYRKYERMYRRVVEFMKKKYNITDIPLREIKYQFIVDLEFFLRTEYKYSQHHL